MASAHPNIADQPYSWAMRPCALHPIGRLSFRNVYFRLFIFALLIGFVSGCQRWPGTQAMRQYQLESDRLLAEFRSQKKRAEELESRNNQLEQRLSESEKLIARMQGGGQNRLGSNSRNSSPSSRTTDPTEKRNGLAIPDYASSRSGSPRSGSGLPDADNPTPGFLTSNSYRDDNAPSLSVGKRDPKDLIGDPGRSNQWRPRPANR